MDFPINKTVAAVLAVLGTVILTGGPLAAGGTLTWSAIAGVVVPAAILAIVGKLGIDPDAPFNLPAVVSGFALTAVAVWKVVDTSIADGHLTGAEIAAILGTLFNQIYQTQSQPHKLGFKR